MSKNNIIKLVITTFVVISISSLVIFITPIRADGPIPVAPICSIEVYTDKELYVSGETVVCGMENTMLASAGCGESPCLCLEKKIGFEWIQQGFCLCSTGSFCPGDTAGNSWILNETLGVGEFRVEGSFTVNDSRCQGYAYFNVTPFIPLVTQVSVDPQQTIVTGGQEFTINITIDPVGLIGGAQVSIHFDPTLLAVTAVTDGGMFDMWNPSQLEIDNVNGAISNIIAFDLESVSTPGIFAKVTFTAKAKNGISNLNLSNDVLVGSPEALPLTSNRYNGSVTVVWEPWDINRDGRTNILDLIIIGQHWGETGPPCWIPYDVNFDGVINILDMILVGQYWTG